MVCVCFRGKSYTFQVFVIANSYRYHTDFAPTGCYTLAHMLEVITLIKIPFRLLATTVMARQKASQTRLLLVISGKSKW